MSLNIVDYIVLGLLLLIGLIYLVKGFVKNGLNDIFFLIIIAAAVFLSPIIAKALLGVDFIANFAPTLENALSFLKKDGVGLLALKIILLAVSAIVILLVVGLILKLVKHFLQKALKPKGALKVIDKLFGLVFGVAFYGVMCLGVLGAVGTIKSPAIEKTFSESFIVQKNFLAPYCEKYLNIGDLIESLTPKEDPPADEKPVVPPTEEPVVPPVEKP